MLRDIAIKFGFYILGFFGDAIRQRTENSFHHGEMFTIIMCLHTQTYTQIHTDRYSDKQTHEERDSRKI